MHLQSVNGNTADREARQLTDEPMTASHGTKAQRDGIDRETGNSGDGQTR